MKKVFVVVLLIACSLGVVARADTYRKPGAVVLQQRERRDEGRRHDEERRRQDEQKRRQDEERRRRDEEQRKRDEERRRQEEQKRRQDEERRRHEEERRRRPEPPRHRDEFPDRDHRNPGFGDRLRAKEVLRETAEYLERAQRAARYGHFREGLGKAYAHQEEARNLYYEGRYERAIVHSMRAREIAIDIIEINREGRSGRRHGRYWQKDSLDDELSIRIFDDNIAIKLKINLD